MSEQEVDLLDFTTYESRLFAIFNNAILHSMGADKFRTSLPEEEYDELFAQIEMAKEQGYTFR